MKSKLNFENKPDVTALELIQSKMHIPGIATAVIAPHDKITTQSAGVVRTDQAKPLLITDSTVFEAASLSKPIFAYIVLKMAERRQIDLDKPLYEYFSDQYKLALMPELPENNHELAETGMIYLSDKSDYFVRDPNRKVQQGKLDDTIDLSDLGNRINDLKLKSSILDQTLERGHTDGFGPPEMRRHENYKKLTARMILSHQAGLPNEFDPPKVPLDYVSPAGTKFDYSGAAYFMLNEIIEKIAKQPLEALAQKEFYHLGMTNSSFLPPTGCSLIANPKMFY